jgi:YggT family protein
MIAALRFIIEAVANIILLFILMRFWLPWFRVDFRNPISQAILKFTGPLVIPMRRVLPSIRQFDTATFFVAFAVQFVALMIVMSLRGFGWVDVDGIWMFLLFVTLLSLAILSCTMFLFIIFISIVIRLFAPYNPHPIATLLHSIADPILRPFRGLIPPVGSFDLSPMIPIILLGALRVLLYSWMPVGA